MRDVRYFKNKILYSEINYIEFYITDIIKESDGYSYEFEYDEVDRIKKGVSKEKLNEEINSTIKDLF